MIICESDTPDKLFMSIQLKYWFSLGQIPKYNLTVGTSRDHISKIIFVFSQAINAI